MEGCWIIEVKRGNSPRGAIDQLLDYFGMMKLKFPEKPVEMMVVANIMYPRNVRSPVRAATLSVAQYPRRHSAKLRQKSVISLLLSRVRRVSAY